LRVISYTRSVWSTTYQPLSGFVWSQQVTHRLSSASKRQTVSLPALLLSKFFDVAILGLSGSRQGAQS
jgi:hypothetical protein